MPISGDKRVFPGYIEGAFGTDFGDIALPDPTDGLLITAHNTDEEETRQYSYADGKWWYIDLAEV